MNEVLKKEYLNIVSQLKLGNKKELFIRNSYFEMATYVIHKFSNNPWILQSEILDHFKIEISDLLTLNDIIRSSKLFQNIILKEGIGKKYWNSIIPFAKNTDLVLDKKTFLTKENSNFSWSILYVFLWILWKKSICQIPNVICGNWYTNV